MDRAVSNKLTELNIELNIAFFLWGATHCQDKTRHAVGSSWTKQQVCKVLVRCGCDGMLWQVNAHNTEKRCHLLNVSIHDHFIRGQRFTAQDSEDAVKSQACQWHSSLHAVYKQTQSIYFTLAWKQKKHNYITIMGWWCTFYTAGAKVCF